LLDSQHRPLTLNIAFDQFAEPAMKFLETAAIDSLRNSIIIGRVQRTPQELSLHPFTIYLENREPIHL
jgi:hypothetical protein